MFAISLHTLVSLVSLGMALAFLSVDARSRTSQALAVSLGTAGVAIFLNVSLIDLAVEPPTWSGWLAIPESVALMAMLEWLLRVRQTLPAAPGLNTLFGDRVLRLGQFSAALYSVFAVIVPEWRLQYFARAAVREDAWTDWQFWLFAAPIEFAALCGLIGMALLLRRKPDRIEKLRVMAMALAVPFFLVGFVLPSDLAAVSCIIGEILILIGSVHYYMAQGQRGQFMARFLSPDVARLVNERGLVTAMRENQLEITVVCADLRGFTPFASAQSSSAVLQVLREYYDAVGDVVAEHGATIKDYAGDGVLILVGAPLPRVDHAAHGVRLAHALRERCQRLAEQWAARGWPLGIGLGVASGPVTVGIIGSTALEYTAVGAAVNLASRLCEQAQPGEILVAAAAAADPRLEPRPAVAVKGFAEPVRLFALPA